MLAASKTVNAADRVVQMLQAGRGEFHTVLTGSVIFMLNRNSKGKDS